MGPAPTYTYRQLADRIETELGERPSLSALRAAAATARRTSSPRPRPRLTAGMPKPLPAPAITSPALFSQAAVDRWLLRHPLRGWSRAYQQLVTRSANSRTPLAIAVRQARSAGLSWRQIARAVSEGTGTAHSPAGLHRAYRDHNPAAGQRSH